MIQSSAPAVAPCSEALELFGRKNRLDLGLGLVHQGLDFGAQIAVKSLELAPLAPEDGLDALLLLGREVEIGAREVALEGRRVEATGPLRVADPEQPAPQQAGGQTDHEDEADETQRCDPSHEPPPSLPASRTQLRTAVVGSVLAAASGSTLR